MFFQTDPRHHLFEAVIFRTLVFRELAFEARGAMVVVVRVTHAPVDMRDTLRTTETATVLTTAPSALRLACAARLFAQLITAMPTTAPSALRMGVAVQLYTQPLV
jgi:hypothetical protein